jgi:hypothetical protein
MQRILQKAKCVAVAALAVSTAALLPLPGDGSWGEALAFETVGNDFGGDTDRESDGFGRSDYGEGGAEGGRTHLDRLVPMPDEWRESGGAPEVVPAQTQRTVRRPAGRRPRSRRNPHSPRCRQSPPSGRMSSSQRAWTTL